MFLLSSLLSCVGSKDARGEAKGTSYTAAELAATTNEIEGWLSQLAQDLAAVAAVRGNFYKKTRSQIRQFSLRFVAGGDAAVERYCAASLADWEQVLLPKFTTEFIAAMPKQTQPRQQAFLLRMKAYRSKLSEESALVEDSVPIEESEAPIELVAKMIGDHELAPLVERRCERYWDTGEFGELQDLAQQTGASFLAWIMANRLAEDAAVWLGPSLWVQIQGRNLAELFCDLPDTGRQSMITLARAFIGGAADAIPQPTSQSEGRAAYSITRLMEEQEQDPHFAELRATRARRFLLARGRPADGPSAVSTEELAEDWQLGKAIEALASHYWYFGFLPDLRSGCPNCSGDMSRAWRKFLEAGHGEQSQ